MTLLSSYSKTVKEINDSLPSLDAENWKTQQVPHHETTSITALESEEPENYDALGEPYSASTDVHHGIEFDWKASSLNRDIKQVESFVKLDPKAKQIIRNHYIGRILIEFREFCKNFDPEDTSTIVYVQKLFYTMREIRDLSWADPFLDFVLALYDAMAYKNNWINYSIEQYNLVVKLFEKFDSRKTINVNSIEKAIIELENIGFDTLPFEIEIEVS